MSGRVHFVDEEEEIYRRKEQYTVTEYPNHKNDVYDPVEYQQKLSLIPYESRKPLKSFGDAKVVDDPHLQFSSHLDRFDRNWREDPFWKDLYPRWAEPIFKDGLDVRTNIVNDRQRFAVDIDAYQFRPEELTVKTLDDTLLIEGRHEDVRDSDNYTKMYFVRKYQLPPDVHPQDISSSINSSGRLSVEARKPYAAIEGRERNIPIEGSSRRVGSRSSSYTGDRLDSGRGSAWGQDINRQQNDIKKKVGFLSNFCRRRPNKVEPPKMRKADSFPSLSQDLVEYGYNHIPRVSYNRNVYNDNPRSYWDRYDKYDDYYGRDHRGSNYNLADRNGGYKTEYSHHSNDGNGSRHESRRSEFREEVRGSPPPLPPVNNTLPVRESYSRSASRSSRREYTDGGFRSSSRGPDFRDEHLLRPTPEIDDRYRSGGSRSVRIERREEVH